MICLVYEFVFKRRFYLSLKYLKVFYNLNPRVSYMVSVGLGGMFYLKKSREFVGKKRYGLKVGINISSFLTSKTAKH